MKEFCSDLHGYQLTIILLQRIHTDSKSKGHALEVQLNYNRNYLYGDTCLSRIRLVIMKMEIGNGVQHLYHVVIAKT